MENVLHKPTPPPDIERWHIILKGGHPEELLAILERITRHEAGVIQTAEWLDNDILLICLKWIDDVIPRFIQDDVNWVNPEIEIKENGRAVCHGHNLST